MKMLADGAAEILPGFRIKVHQSLDVRRINFHILSPNNSGRAVLSESNRLLMIFLQRIPALDCMLKNFASLNTSVAEFLHVFTDPGTRVISSMMVMYDSSISESRLAKSQLLLDT